jgi:two-component system response regulator FixJ
MPGMDGIALLKRLKEDNAKHGVVVMTGHGDIPLAVEAMKLGAVDFIEKPFDDDRLIDAIRAAFAGAAGAAGASQDDAITAQLATRLKSLSPRERQVMEGLAAGLSNKAIARDYAISPRTVEVYRANMMTKMHAANLSELVRMAMRTGLLKD